jgi:hypothetical protein
VWCTALLKNGGKEMNSDLKIGHVSPKTECVRMYVCAFKRTCAECVCVKWAMRSNIKGTFECICASVCVCDGALWSNRRK